MSIRKTYVGPEGSKDAKLMIVGEAPGAQEERTKRPFVGKSGKLLERYLQRNRVQRDEVWLTNLCKYRPKSNRFTYLLGSPQLEDGLEELKHEIETVNPNVILALGAWPGHYLTGISDLEGKGITKWRGSILPSNPALFEGRKVVLTVHPSYVLRVWSWNPVFNFDISKAVKQSKFPDLVYPAYDGVIDPSSAELLEHVEAASQAPLVAVDIETFPGRYSCIGFAYRTEGGGLCGVCVTYKRPELLGILEDFWRRDDIKKCFQFGTYDVSFMRHFYDWEVGGYPIGGWDTYVAAASIMPEFPRGLDFLNSIYTDLPYYKTERKVWKEQGDMQILWEYNIKDTVATLLIAEKQQEEIQEIFEGGNDVPI